MNKLKPIVSGLAMAGLLSAGISAQAAVIDDFSTDQTFLVDDSLSDGGESSQVTGGGIIQNPADMAGERDLFVELLASPDSTNVNASFGVSAGALRFQSDDQATGRGIVQWDGIDGSDVIDPTGLGGIDLASMGSQFQVDILFSDLGFNFIVTVWTNAMDFTELSLSATGTTTGTTEFIPFAAFSNCGALNVTCNGAGVDFSSVGAIQVDINPLGSQAAIDFTIDAITTVPEPATLALFGAGLLGIGAATRKHRKTAS